ncbi:MAG: hypothetical protein AAB152_18115 [Candidatus Coatesbacteria bacterium]
MPARGKPRPGGPPLSAAELRFLRALVRAKVDFMIVGLSAAALQGAPVVTQDVDLWFRDLNDPRLHRTLRKVGSGILEPVGLNPPVLLGEGVDLFDLVTHMHGLEGFAEEMKHAVRISLGSFRVPVLPLDRVIASKRALGRPKDELYLRVLADTRKAVRRR